MTSLLSGRHKYLTNKNTKKGQKVRKISALSALKNGYYRVQILSEAVFLKWYLFFCTLYPQTSWLRKSEQTREKPPKSWDFGGSKPWYLFWLHYMAAVLGFWTSNRASVGANLFVTACAIPFKPLRAWVGSNLPVSLVKTIRASDGCSFCFGSGTRIRT